MNAQPRVAVYAWLFLIIVCIWIIGHTRFEADLSAFLPRSPTPAQQILVEQLREGVVSRLILIGLEGDKTEALVDASKRLAAHLRSHRDFLFVNNGEDAAPEKDRDFLWRNRYLLSPAVNREHFSAQALRAALEDNLQMLGSPVGMLLRRVLPADPTGELLHLIEQFEGQTKPAVRDGVWFSRDGNRALLMVQTRAAGYDIDAQEQAQTAIRAAFAEASRTSSTRLVMSGPGVFSVDSRASIKNDAWRFSVLATGLISAMLLLLYRSPRVLVLGLLPVVSGALAGVAAVSLGFGSVHGITLGFGVTLIGEGVDYAIYLFTQSEPGRPPHETLERIWPTLRLGVLTSICGFAAMLFSGFPGLAQLGLFSIAGLIVAVSVTRFVLPGLMPQNFAPVGVRTLARYAIPAVGLASRLRYPMLAAVALSAAFLLFHREPLWSDNLASLSPIAQAQQVLDQQLRADLGAPDIRFLAVIHSATKEDALLASEKVAIGLKRSVEENRLKGFDAPTAILPSLDTQRARQTALPVPDALRKNLREALEGLPYRSDVFEPFIKSVTEAQNAPLLDRESLQGTGLAIKFDSLVVGRESGWMSMVPLRGVSDLDGIVRNIGQPPAAQLMVLDLKREADDLYLSYRDRALFYALLGAVGIVALLIASLRSIKRVYDVLAPLVAAVIVTIAVIVLLE
ncbi:MAG TPA: MMPL family transporter, partial [Candidatus Saccharimonadales bacterium]|nr:MMPL family transporter [Candidatus Saccharimonadales bacterium]